MLHLCIFLFFPLHYLDSFKVMNGWVYTPGKVISFYWCTEGNGVEKEMSKRSHIYIFAALVPSSNFPDTVWGQFLGGRFLPDSGTCYQLLLESCCGFEWGSYNPHCSTARQTMKRFVPCILTQNVMILCLTQIQVHRGFLLFVCSLTRNVLPLFLTVHHCITALAVVCSGSVPWSDRTVAVVYQKRTSIPAWNLGASQTWSGWTLNPLTVFCSKWRAWKGVCIPFQEIMAGLGISSVLTGLKTQLLIATTVVFPVPNALPTVLQQCRHLCYRMIAASLWAIIWMLTVPGHSLTGLNILPSKRACYSMCSRCEVFMYPV